MEDVEKIQMLFENQSQIEPPEGLFDDIIEAIEFEGEAVSKDQTLKTRENIYESIMILLVNIRYQISLFDKKFWFVSIAIMCIGLVFIVKGESDQIVLLAPTTTLYSIYYLYRGGYYDTSEIESACKYSMYEITLARTIIIIVYNIVFACLLAVANTILMSVNLWVMIVITWLAPLLITYCVALYFFYKKGMIASVLANVSIWTGYIYLYRQFHINNAYLYNQKMWININLVCILLSLLILFILLNNMRKVYR